MSRQVAAGAFIALVAGIVTLAIRLPGLDDGYDVLTDEITYVRLSQTFINEFALELYGEPFYLHPPAFFVLGGLDLRLAAASGELYDQVLALRWLNACLAALSAALLSTATFIATRSRLAALGAATLFALDAFVVRMNSRVLLETLAITAVLAGYAVLLLVQRRHLGVAWAIGAGMLFGLALLTKEMTAALTVAPMMIVFIIGSPLPRRVAGTVLGASVITYTTYPVAVFIGGDLDGYVSHKLRGVARFVGLVQETGFNQPGGPSFVDAVIANLGTFGTTYALLAGGVVAVGVALTWGGARLRLVGIFGACSYLLILYSVTLGTLEEQFFYFVVVPAMFAIACAAPTAMSARPRVRPALLLVAVVVAGLFVGWSSRAWYVVQTAPDDGYRRLIAFVEEQVDRGAQIAVPSGPARFILRGYRLSPSADVTLLQRGAVDYVIVSTKLAQEGYAPSDAQALAYLDQNATEIFEFRGRTYGDLRLYQLQQPPS